MINYEEIKMQLESIEGTKLSPPLRSNADEFGLPKEYDEFLKQVEFGRIGKSQFQFYDGIVFADEIYGQATSETDDLFIFGDDYQGACVGFDKKNWGIVRVMPDQSISQIADSFEQFITKEFLHS